MTLVPDFYDAEALERLAITLFHGWGYHFYRVENQLRADDLLVRAKVGWLLGQARAGLDAAESAYRGKHLPPPSREKPRPDAEAVAGARRLEALGAGLGALAARIGALPVPENDRMTQRHRAEDRTLAALLLCDERLVGQAVLLARMVEGRDGAALLADAAAIEDGCAALAATLRDRQALLL